MKKFLMILLMSVAVVSSVHSQTQNKTITDSLITQETYVSYNDTKISVLTSNELVKQVICKYYKNFLKMVVYKSRDNDSGEMYNTYVFLFDRSKFNITEFLGYIDSEEKPKNDY